MENKQNNTIFDIVTTRANKYPNNFWITYRNSYKNIIQKGKALYLRKKLYNKEKNRNEIFLFKLEKIDSIPKKYFLQALTLPLLIYIFHFLLGLKLILTPFFYQKQYLFTNNVYFLIGFLAVFAMPFLNLFTSSNKEKKIIFFSKYILVLSTIACLITLGILFAFPNYKMTTIAYCFVLMAFIYWDERVFTVISDFKNSTLYAIENNDKYFINWDKNVFFILINANKQKKEIK